MAVIQESGVRIQESAEKKREISKMEYMDIKGPMEQLEDYAAENKRKEIRS